MKWKLKQFSERFLFIVLLLVGCFSTLLIKTTETAQALELTTSVRFNQVTSQRIWGGVSDSLILPSNVYNSLNPYFYNINVTDGQFFEWTFTIENITENNALDARIPTFYSQTNNVTIIGQSAENIGASVSKIHVYGYFSANMTFNNMTLGTHSAMSLLTNERAVGGLLTVYNYIDNSAGGGSSATVDFTQVINAINSIKTDVEYNGKLIQAIENTLLRTREIDAEHVQDIIDAINDNATANADKEQQAGEEATDEAQNEADSAQEDSEQTGQSLLSALSGFVNAITAINPGSCSLNGRINNDVNLGTLNFCDTNPPSFITIIGSIILVVIIIPYVKYMFNKFIGIIRSFQK